MLFPNWVAWGLGILIARMTIRSGVSALDTPKLENCCLFVFGKGFGVDTQRLVGDTSSSQHDERAFAFVSLLVSLGTSPSGDESVIRPTVS